MRHKEREDACWAISRHVSDDEAPLWAIAAALYAIAGTPSEPPHLQAAPTALKEGLDGIAAAISGRAEPTPKRGRRPAV